MYTKEKAKKKKLNKKQTKRQKKQKSNTLFKVRLSHCQDQGYVFSTFFCETDVCQWIGVCGCASVGVRICVCAYLCVCVSVCASVAVPDRTSINLRTCKKLLK